MAEYSNDMFGLKQLLLDEAQANQQADINNAVNLAGTKRSGMMLNAIDIGKTQGAALEGFGRFLTGTEAPVDPRLQKMQLLESIQKEMPMPQTAADYKKLANMLSKANLFNEAQLAMQEANKIEQAALTRSKETFQDINGATRFKATGQLVPGESAVKTTTPAELTLDQLFTNTLENDPAYQTAVATGNVETQQKMIAEAKRTLNLAGDTSNAQIQNFPEYRLNKKGDMQRYDVYKQYNKKDNEWVEIQESQQELVAAATRTYVNDTPEGTFEITETWNGQKGKWVQTAQTNKTDLPNSFEAAVVQSVVNSPGYNELDTSAKAQLLKTAKESITIPTTESAINAAYRDIANDFIEQAQNLEQINNNENYIEDGRVLGNKAFMDWKNDLQIEVEKAGGNTEVGDVLGQYKLWKDLSSGTLDSLDQMENLKDQIDMARGTGVRDPNSKAWAQATRSIVALTKDSNLSLAEVNTIANAGSVPRKIKDFVNKIITGVASEASIDDFEEIAVGLERVLIERYNKNHTDFNAAFAVSGTSEDLLQAITGNPLKQDISVIQASYPDIVKEAERRNLIKIIDGKIFSVATGQELNIGDFPK
jgi:hypothetical protein